MRKRKRLSRPKPLDKDDEEMIGEMNAYISLCFAMVEDMTYHSLAKLSGLSPSTLHSLFHYGLRKGTHYATIHRLGKACGLSLTWEENKPRLRIVS
jgi:hypothetical protein